MFFQNIVVQILRVFANKVVRGFGASKCGVYAGADKRLYLRLARGKIAAHTNAAKRHWQTGFFGPIRAQIRYDAHSHISANKPAFMYQHAGIKLSRSYFFDDVAEIDGTHIRVFAEKKLQQKRACSV